MTNSVLRGNNKLTTTFFTMAVAASAFIPLFAETYTSTSYVQREHLIAQWDGIDNAGTGTHDPTATVWKDLVGTRHLTLQSGGSWSTAGNALVVNGKSAEYNGTAPACKTIEVVFKMTNSDGKTLLFGGNQTTRQLIMFSDAGTNCYFEGLANVGHRLAVGNFCSGTLRSVSGTFSTPGQVASAMYVDGRQEVSGATLQNSWGNATEKIMIGLYPSGKYAWYGEVYSIRMYDCELTAREVIANHEIDEARFGEALPPSSSYTSADYVQDGLITQWDGIDNAGMGTHNPNATVWKDLAGNLDLTLTANGSWTNGNALSINDTAAYGSTITPAYKTIEVVYSKPFQTKGCVFFHSGIANRFFLFRSEEDLAPTNKVYFEAGKSTKFFYKRATPGEVTSAVALYGDDDSVVDLFCDGERKTDGTYTEGWGLRKRVSVGGRYSDDSTQLERSPAKGEVYAIRLYSRRLTKAELAHNNMIDRRRFMTSASYTQDGLIGQWDGENNAGTGIHDSRATVWKDLKGGLDFLLTSRGSWNVAGNALVADEASALGETPAPSYKTLEVAYRSTYQKPVAADNVGHNSVLFNSYNDGRQMVYFREYGQNAYFSGISSTEKGVKHVGVSIGTFNSNAVHVLAATYTNVNAQAAVSYLDGVLNTRASVHDSWTPRTTVMILGDQKETSFRPFYGEVYALRLYDRELTADELAADAAMDQKRIFAPRVMTWENLSDGNFGTSGKWTVSGTGGQDIPRYSDRVFLPAGDYAVTLDEDWVIGELSVGADATLKLALPRSKGMLPPTPLTVLNGIEAAATAGLSLEAKGFNKEHHDKRFTLIECGSDSTAALQTLANSLNASLGRNCTVVEDGTRLVYIVPPRPGLIISVQ